MGDKKKRKEKTKEKKRTKKKEEKKKSRKERESSSSDSSEESSSSSSSRSRSREQKKKSSFKSKEKEKKVEKIKDEGSMTNILYNFEANTPTSFPAMIPGMKGLSIPTIPPPAPNVPPPTPVPKPKTKQVNIFKLLPKLNYGPVMLAKTLYATRYIEQTIYQKILREACENMEKTARDQGYKKASQLLQKCISDLQKAGQEQDNSDQARAQLYGMEQTRNRYSALRQSYDAILNDH